MFFVHLSHYLSLIVFFCLCLFFPPSRFGKKKEEKKEAKAARRQKSDIMSDHEFERMKEERERWGALMVRFFFLFSFLLLIL